MANQLVKIEAIEDSLPGFWPKNQKSWDVGGTGWNGDMGDWVGGGGAGNVYSSGGRGYDSSPGTAVNYASLAGDLWQNSAVQSVLNWLIRAWPESYPCVKQMRGDKKVKVEHPLTGILMDPNPFDDDTTLWAGTIVSLWCDGNAYWRINRDRGGRVREFEYIPHWAICPYREIGSTNPGPDYYKMWTNGNNYVELEPYDVVHFRFGRDPYYDLLGMSQWMSARIEVYTDNTGGNFTATTLRHRGMPWMIVSPSTAEGEFEDPVGLRDHIEARTTGDNAGRVVVLSLAANIATPGPMKDMGLSELRNIPVHRICALAGIDVDSLGLGDAGDHVTFQNQKAADKKSWGTVIQVQRMIGRQLSKQVLWRRENFNEPKTYYAGFDYSEVRALEPDKAEEWKRVNDAIKNGTITRTEGRAEIGYVEMTSDQRAEVLEYERSLMPEPPPAPVMKPVAAAASGNGTGKAHEGDLLRDIREKCGELWRG